MKEQTHGSGIGGLVAGQAMAMGELMYWWKNGELRRDKVVGWTTFGDKTQVIISITPERIYIVDDVFATKNQALNYQIQKLQNMIED